MRKQKKNPIAVQLGKRGGRARRKQLFAMTAEDRRALARKAAQKRWADYRAAREQND